jgi:hypothetical protein
MNSANATRFLLALAASLTLWATAGTSEPGDVRAIEKVYVDRSGVVHVVPAGGGDRKVRKEKDQTGTWMLRSSEDQSTVGWLAEFGNCCTSYPIPLKLVIYRNGKVRRRFGDGMMIYDWRFWAEGKQAAFCSGTVHGDSGGHCELHDINTGKTLDTIDAHLDENSPPWARGLID